MELNDSKSSCPQGHVGSNPTRSASAPKQSPLCFGAFSLPLQKAPGSNGTSRNLMSSGLFWFQFSSRAGATGAALCLQAQPGAQRARYAPDAVRLGQQPGR